MHRLRRMGYDMPRLEPKSCVYVQARPKAAERREGETGGGERRTKSDGGSLSANRACGGATAVGMVALAVAGALSQGGSGRHGGQFGRVLAKLAALALPRGITGQSRQRPAKPGQRPAKQGPQQGQYHCRMNSARSRTLPEVLRVQRHTVVRRLRCAGQRPDAAPLRIRAVQFKGRVPRARYET